MSQVPICTTTDTLLVTGRQIDTQMLLSDVANWQVLLHEYGKPPTEFLPKFGNCCFSWIKIGSKVMSCTAGVILWGSQPANWVAGNLSGSIWRFTMVSQAFRTQYRISINLLLNNPNHHFASGKYVIEVHLALDLIRRTVHKREMSANKRSDVVVACSCDTTATNGEAVALVTERQTCSSRSCFQPLLGTECRSARSLKICGSINSTSIRIHPFMIYLRSTPRGPSPKSFTASFNL